MSYVIDEDFTHNEMIIEGKDAVNFFRNFQHVMHESRQFNVVHTKKIEYEFRYHGKPNHDYLVLVKKEFPLVQFKSKDTIILMNFIVGLKKFSYSIIKDCFKVTLRMQV